VAKKKDDTSHDERVKRMNLNVRASVHDDFKAATASQGTTMTKVLLEFIQQYVDKNGVQPVAKKGRKQ
jgi:hypothetical protein